MTERTSRPPATAAAILMGAGVVLAATPGAADETKEVVVVNGVIPEPLTGTPGDPVRGRAIVANRQVGLCLLCHSAPIPEERFQGDLAPDLAGAGARATEGALRARIVDPRINNPATIMPPYHVTTGLTRVAPAFRGKPLLDAQQIEDVVAYLVTLK